MISYDIAVEAVMLTGGTSKDDVRDVNSRFIGMASSKGYDGKEIKLCYVTVRPSDLLERRLFIAFHIQPEKISKSKQFLSMLEKLANSGKLGVPFGFNIHRCWRS